MVQYDFAYRGLSRGRANIREIQDETELYLGPEVEEARLGRNSRALGKGYRRERGWDCVLVTLRSRWRADIVDHLGRQVENGSVSSWA